MRKDALLFALAVAAFAGLRLWHLTYACLDCDEIWSLRFAEHDWPGLLRAVASDVSHPPLFYLLLKGWIAVGGESLAWLRLFPALTAVACVAPLALLARALRLGWAEINLTVAFLAVNAFLIDFAQYLRMFDLLQFFALVSLWRFVRFVEAPPGDRRAAVWLAAVNVALVYTHYWGWVVIGTEGLYLLLCRRTKVLAFVATVLAAAVCFAPWALAVACVVEDRGSAATQIQWIGRPGWVDLARFYVNLVGSFRVPGTAAVGLALFVGPVALLGWHALSLRRAWQSLTTPFADSGRATPEVLGFVLLALVAVVPPAVTFAASRVLPQSVWAERQLTFVAGPFLMLVAAAACRLRPVVPAACAAWAVAAGLAGLAGPDRHVAWDRLAAAMVRAEPPGNGPVPVYAADAHVAWCLQFHLDAARPGGFRVAVDPAAADGGGRFWVATRGTEALDRLAGRGYAVGPGSRAASQFQTVAVHRVRRPTGGEEASITTTGESP